MPSSRRWLLCSRTAPEDQLSFTTSTATDCDQSTPHKHSSCGGGYTTVSTSHQKIFPHYRGILILTRIWIGLFLCLVQTAIYINVVLNHDTKYWQQHSLPKYKPNMDSAIKVCLDNYKYCDTINTPVDNTYLWFIIPQLLNGLSSLLVSMTAFEFICAQAPRTTQGLLIGLWYATFSIRYLAVGTLDNVITEKRSWLICEGVKGFLDPGVSCAVLMYVQTLPLPLPTARRDSQCAGNDRRHS